MVSVNSTKIDWRSITDINVISPRPPWQQPPPASLPFLRPPLHPAARLGQAFRAQTPPPCVGRRPGVFCIKCLVKPPHSPATKSSVSSTRRHASQGLCTLAPSAANPPLASRFWRRPQLKQHSYAPHASLSCTVPQPPPPSLLLSPHQVIHSLVIYGIYKMKVNLTWPDDAGTRDLITWSLVVMSCLPILFVAPLHSLPNQIIEKDVIGSRFSRQFPTTFLMSYFTQPHAPRIIQIHPCSCASQGNVVHHLPPFTTSITLRHDGMRRLTRLAAGALLAF